MQDPIVVSHQSAPIESGQQAPIVGEAIIGNRWFTLIWRILMVVIGITGIIVDSKSLPGFAGKLVFFTIQSNIILILCMGYLVVANLRKASGLSPALKTAAVVYISITGLVYNLVLARLSTGGTPVGITIPLLNFILTANMMLHIIAPLMAIFDWVFLQKHERIRWLFALIWVAYPLAYECFAIIRGALINSGLIGGSPRYPYPFINVDQIGYGGVAINTVIYGVIFWLIGVVYVALDRLLARRKR